ncbi:MAG TPA: hypothetical protein VJ978_13650 [Nitriliruptoraceae bacterium]|nr:hypothetical protein [Nitriliruptoraceae bacterium]
MKTPTRIGIALAAITLLTAVPATGAPETEQICHDNGTGSLSLLTLPTTAAANHAANHDHDVPPVDGNCTDTLPRDVLAQATTVHPVTGESVMVAEFVDANGSREPDAGDVVRTGAYPLDFAVTGIAPFAVTEHVLVEAEWFSENSIDALIVPNAISPNFRFTDSDFKDGFSEAWDGGFSAFNDFYGEAGSSFLDGIYIEEGSPSLPTVHAWVIGEPEDDDDFLDVTIVDH